MRGASWVQGRLRIRQEEEAYTTARCRANQHSEHMKKEGQIAHAVGRLESMSLRPFLHYGIACSTTSVIARAFLIHKLGCMCSLQK
jgi:hypothetical protein